MAVMNNGRPNRSVGSLKEGKELLRKEYESKFKKPSGGGMMQWRKDRRKYIQDNIYNLNIVDDPSMYVDLRNETQPYISRSTNKSAKRIAKDNLAVERARLESPEGQRRLAAAGQLTPNMYNPITGKLEEGYNLSTVKSNEFSSGDFVNVRNEIPTREPIDFNRYGQYDPEANKVVYTPLPYQFGRRNLYGNVEGTGPAVEAYYDKYYDGYNYNPYGKGEPLGETYEDYGMYSPDRQQLTPQSSVTKKDQRIAKGTPRRAMRELGNPSTVQYNRRFNELDTRFDIELGVADTRGMNEFVATNPIGRDVAGDVQDAISYKNRPLGTGRRYGSTDPDYIRGWSSRPQSSLDNYLRENILFKDNTEGNNVLNNSGEAIRQLGMLRKDMVDKGIINHPYDNITVDHLQKAVEMHQQGQLVPNNDKSLFEGMEMTPENLKVLEQIINLMASNGGKNSRGMTPMTRAVGYGMA